MSVIIKNVNYNLMIGSDYPYYVIIIVFIYYMFR